MSGYNNSNEITVAELLIKIKKWWYFLLSKWLTIILIGIIGGVLGFIYSKMSKPQYKAEISFVLSAGDGNKMSGLSGLAGQLGLDMGGGNNDVFTGDNITSLITSRRMVQKVLFKKPVEGGQLLINTIVSELKLNERWAKAERTKNAFPFPENAALLNPVQDSLTREVYTIVAERIVSVSKPNKKQSIFQAEAIFTNESVAFLLPGYLVNETAQFYIKTKTKVAQENLNMIQHEADSLRRLLSGTIASTASSVDQTFNLNTAYQALRAPAQEGQMKVTVLNSAYAEVLRNLELAKISLQKETPLFQILDEPSLPLIKRTMSPVKAIITGSLIAMFITIIVITLRKIFKQISIL